MQSRMLSWCEAVDAIGEDAMEEYCDHMPDSSIKTRGGKKYSKSEMIAIVLSAAFGLAMFFVFTIALFLC